MLKVIAYTGGHQSPSGVFRVQQYIPALKESGIEMRECSSWAGTHPPHKKWVRPFWGALNLAERFPDTLRSFGYDVVFFQREMLSTFVTWEPLTKRPRVFDVDDAIWMHPRGGFAERMARLCDHVICGNQFLAGEFSRWNRNVSILPTAVDVHSFIPRAEPHDPERLVIGWMGLSHNLKYLYSVERSLDEVLRRHPEATLRVVTGEPPKFRSLPAGQVEYVRWTPENEIRSIQEMTIGIMPLDDTLYSRGKCAYKMLLYMACGLPVVVSPVGMNAEVLAQDNVGFGPNTDADWVEHLDQLLRDRSLRQRMGVAGREVIVKHYSVEALAPTLTDTLRSIAAQ
jgi:glycosyltransferase involved in cell wall biosynthesis